MNEQISRDEIVTAVRSSAQDVFSTMLNLPLEVGDAYEDPKEPGSFDGVISIVGIGGAWTGTGRIWCSSAFACKLAEAFLMTPYDRVDEDVLDAMAELGNMIIGNVKNVLEERLGPLGLSVPTVIFGRNYRARSAGVPSWTVVPFRSGNERMDVSFCLMPVRVLHASPRAEALQSA